MPNRVRNKLKLLLLIVGIIILFILLLTQALRHKKEELPPEIELHEIVIKNYDNVLLTQTEEDAYSILVDDQAITIAADDFADSVAKPKLSQPTIADVTLQDDVVTSLTLKEEKISGKLLSRNQEMIELAEHGEMKLSPNARFYQIYGQTKEVTAGKLMIGYDFSDYVVKDGVICAALITRDDSMDNIRILLKTNEFAGIYHDGVTLTPDTEYEIRYGNETQTHAAGEEVIISPDSNYFTDGENTNHRIYITPKTLTARTAISSIQREQGTPSYRGCFELLKSDEGLIIINELLLEEYLYAVVPSEMPINYPEEALKAQAICARTYAMKQMMNTKYAAFGAHVDDSTAYQVYNNITEYEQTTAAVKDTSGQIVTYQGEIVYTYYFSTSCGYTTDGQIWRPTEEDGDLGYLSMKRLSKPAANAWATAIRTEKILDGFEEMDGQETNDDENQTAAVNDDSEEPSGGASDGALTVGSEDTADGDLGVESEDTADDDLGVDIAVEAFNPDEASSMSEEAFAAYIKEPNPDDFECEESWYRWQMHYGVGALGDINEKIKTRYDANPKMILTKDKEGNFTESEPKKIGYLQDIIVEKRGVGGIIDSLIIQGSDATIKIMTEYNIRYILSARDVEIEKLSGSESVCGALLPSAFFTIEMEYDNNKMVETITLYGGGYGHGAGMSQNGAKEMAKEGMKAEEIIQYFYQDINIEQAYAEGEE